MSDATGAKACGTCARAKIKCEPVEGQAKCKRCARLGKECIVEPRKTRRHAGLRKEDMLRLRSKVDSLEQLIGSSLNCDGKSATASGASTIYPRTESLESLRTMLGVYQREMTPTFPFVVIPEDICLETFTQEKPMLEMAIGIVTRQHYRGEELANLSRNFRDEVGRKVISGGEKTLDLLQSILVYVAWNHLHVFPGSHVTALVHMATALVTEMGLDQDPHSKTGGPRLGALRAIGRPTLSKPSRTLEENRALLGLFWLTSTASTTIIDISGLKFTKACESACRALQDASDAPSDVYLVQLVRIQQLADSIRSILYCGLLDADKCSPVEAAATVSSLEVSVKQLGSELQQNLPQGQILSISYYSLQVYLYQVSLDDRIIPISDVEASSIESFDDFSAALNPPMGYDQRTSCIIALFNAATTIVHQFSNLEDSLIPFLPYPVWVQIGHAILVLSHVLAVSHEVAYPNFFFDCLMGFRTVLERLKHKLEGIISLGKESSAQTRLPEIFEAVPTRLMDICSAVETSAIPYNATE